MNRFTRFMLFVVQCAVLFCGVAAAGYFLEQNWSPLIYRPPHYNPNFRYISDTDKRAFFQALFASFEANNPRSEQLDIDYEVPLKNEELNAYYTVFAKTLKRVYAQGCPTKLVVIKTKWDDPEAKDRVFQVFDIDQCKQ